MTEEKSASFLDTYFEFLPEDMQREIINRCYQRPAPKHCYGDLVVFVSDRPQETISATVTTYSEPLGTYYETERPNDASGVYCVMVNPRWRHEQWTWEYLVRELKSDNSGHYTTEFIRNVAENKENENHYLRDCAFILNEHQLLHYDQSAFAT